MQENILLTAMHWKARGISVIPIRYRDKRPACAWSEYRDRLPTEDELLRWFGSGAVLNIGVVCGGKSGLVVLDFESLDAWDVWRQWARGEITANFIAEHSYQVMTCRGVHVYVGVAETVRTKPLGFMDVKAEGGYVVAPPSVHPSGHIYTALDERAEIYQVERANQIIPTYWLEDNKPAAPQHTDTEHPTGDVWDRIQQADEPGGASVEDIKRVWKIETMFAQLWQTGAHHYLARCPLHDDNRPSMWVDTERQLCGCFAGCTDRPLDVINLYARIKGVSNEEAIREMARRQG